VGVPLPGVTVRIINPDTLEEMPHGTDGEVSVLGVRCSGAL
jgi:acyl-CoA synthetase (AMP-forming)/AMP-acid ligase II